MRINSIRSEQFAGLGERSVALKDGLNIMIGANESGKSSLVDLIYNLFFQSAAMDGRRDKEFKDRYFPKLKGGMVTDFISGEISFTAESGDYKLNKLWAQKTGSCKLTLPDGLVIRDAKQVEDILGEVLGYGRGIYDELVFPSQKRAQTLVRGLLRREDPFSGAEARNVDDIASAISTAVMETGGIDIDAFEKELEEKVSSYEGRWDFSADLPEGGARRGLNNPWEKGAGIIVRSYYDKERAGLDHRNALQAERAVEDANRSYRREKERLGELKRKLERFSKVRSAIDRKNADLKLLRAVGRDLDAMERAIGDWPLKSSQLEKAESLSKELACAKDRELYESVRELKDELARKSETLRGIGTITADDVAKADELAGRIRAEESRLSGMDIAAKITQIGSAEVSVRSAVTGAALIAGSGEVSITEAAVISIPGVAEIELAPRGIDVSEVRSSIESGREGLKDLLGRFGASTPDELRRMQISSAELSAAAERLRVKIDLLLGDTDWDELKARAEASSARPSAEVEADIRALSPGSIDRFIGGLRSGIDAYIEQYAGMDELRGLAAAKRSELAELELRVQSAEKIPEEFAGVDADAYGTELGKEIDDADDSVDSLLRKLADAESSLPEESAESYMERYLEAEAAFEGQKAEHLHWKRIRDVFLRLKEAEKGDPMDDIRVRFSGYLDDITGGSIELGAMDDDLGSALSSGNSRLSFSTVSEGTKDTISLAFRLAVLDHLYPDGGCVAVFDDPFTDMDPARTEQACALIKRFSKRNQVIFVTCDDKYIDLMDGNVIRVSR